MTKIFTICLMILSFNVTYAQNKITGKISDQDNLPLPGTTIFIPDLNKGTVSDKYGNYELLNLPNGKIKIQFSFVGYTNRIEIVDLKGESVELNIILKQTAIEAEEVVVSGGYNSTQHENAVKIDVLKLNTLTIKSTPDFSEVLTQVPGIDMISKGSGVSKPVIRGLSMNDILVLNNGVRFENYQYSDHHPLRIDEFGIEDVEIIKGPASLLYGSDAIGGVINYKRLLTKKIYMNEFDLKAAEWDNNPVIWDRAEAIAKEIKKLIPLNKQMNALEFGAGTGVTSFILKDSLKEITLMDNSSEMVKVMNNKIKTSKVKNLKTLNFNLEQSDFIDAKFDLIFNQMVLHHITDIENIITKFYNLLNPGGFLAIADLYTENGSFHGEGFTGHKGFDPAELSGLLLKQGFENISHRKCFVINKKISDTETKQFDVFLIIAHRP